jgi:NADH-quinone oxidoreductase subunit A
MQSAVLAVFLFVAFIVIAAIALVMVPRLLNPGKAERVKQMPYESGMDPIHDTRRPFTVRFYLLAIAFLVFDVELLFLYPWAVADRPAVVTASRALAADGAAPRGIDAAVAHGLVESRGLVFAGAMVFFALLALGFLYDWRKGFFQWR